MRMYPKQLAQLVRLAINQMIQQKPPVLEHDLYDRDDGLHHCKVCNGGEASLPQHCPGERMRETTAELVQSGQVEFLDGRWIAFGPNTRLPEEYTASLLALRDKQAYLQSLGA